MNIDKNHIQVSQKRFINYSKPQLTMLILTGLVLLLAITSQFYTLLLGKGFWLDEWFLLANVKFRSYPELFGSLDYIQQIPRVYLTILKGVAAIGNYSYASFRIIPTLIQTVNLILIIFVVSRLLFAQNWKKRCIFTLLFLSFHSTLFYYTQFKQYSMEMLMTILCFIAFYKLSKSSSDMGWKRPVWFASSLLFLIGPLLSYSFPIVVSPVLLFLLLEWVMPSSHRSKTHVALMIFSFLIGLGISYFTDLQYVLFDKSQYGNFSENIASFSSLQASVNTVKKLLWLPTSVFFFDKSYPIPILVVLYLLKLVTFTFVTVGFVAAVMSLFNRFNLLKSAGLAAIKIGRRPTPDLYFLGVCLVTLCLFFLKILPIGSYRLNYFLVLPIAYFFIQGINLIIANLNSSPLVSALAVAAFVISALPAVRSSVNELKNQNLNFDQSIYENVGSALEVANMKGYEIWVLNNEFYPESIMTEQESLMIKSHHLYKPSNPLVVHHVLHKKTLMVLPKRINLYKYHFEVID